MLVRDYLRNAGFYSYDALEDDAEDPCKRWIGREVKRFLQKAADHLPFLLRLAAAPADCVPEMSACANADGEQTMEEDDEYAVTEEEVEAEEKKEPLMMQNAGFWDNFLDLVRARQKQWAQRDADTDDYRKERAVEFFNLGNQCSNDLLTLKPTLQSWVPHVLAFVDPQQAVLLGDPTKRACDACESFGAMTKKLIKHNTCRRNLLTGTVEHSRRSADGKEKRWKQTFTKGYIQTAFTRTCVREALLHGEENAPFLQRTDARRTQIGKANTYHKFVAQSADSPVPKIKDLMQDSPE